ncbi:MAG: hypothetical protein ACRD3W_03885 [Terriglobales bacterium]
MEKIVTAGVRPDTTGSADFVSGRSIDKTDEKAYVLNYCREKYATADEKNTFSAQLRQLHKFVELAVANHIALALVIMPVSAEHKKMIPNPLVARFVAELRNLKSQYPITVLDEFDSDAYSDSDFADSLHLTGRGGDKLFGRLRRALAND